MLRHLTGGNFLLHHQLGLPTDQIGAAHRIAINHRLIVRWAVDIARNRLGQHVTL